MPEQKLSLTGLKGGALEERFQRELARVLANIRDPNTSKEKKRSITVKLTFTPADDRQYAAITAEVSSKLAADAPVTTFTLFTERDGELVATEPITTEVDDDPRQTSLAPVTPIGKKEKK